MVLAPLALCIVATSGGAEPLTVRDLAPFARLDASVRALPLPTPRTYAAVTQGLSALAATPVQRARAAYVWTTAHVAYSLDRKRNAAAAMADLTGDCDAHTALYAALCKGMGIECETVLGSIRFGIQPQTGMIAAAKTFAPGQWLVGHSWSAVRIDGRWGVVDPTLGVTPRVQNGTQAAPSDDYFLDDPAVFATDHVPDDEKWLLGIAPKDLSHTPIVRPLAWRSGLNLDVVRAGGHLDEDKRIVLQSRLAWKPGMRAVLQTDMGGMADRALVQPAADGTEIRLSPPGPASLVWLGENVAGVWRPLVGYPIVGPTAAPLPKVMARFYDTGASLVGPFARELKAGQTAEIKLRAPGASQVVAFQGPALAGKFVRDGESWTLRASPTAGAALEIMASYDNPRQFQALVTYDVR